MNREPQRVHIELDRGAVATARRQAADLAKRYGANPIPADMLKASRMAFSMGVRRALIDSSFRGDLDAVMTRLCERHAEAFSSALRRARKAQV